MPLARPFMKWAVLTSSGLLVAGFIGYQAGALDRLTRPQPAAAVAAEKAEEPTGGAEREWFFGGSKSDVIFVDPNTRAPGQATPSDAALMGGSKYMIIPRLAKPKTTDLGVVESGSKDAVGQVPPKDGLPKPGK